jgi:molecular chaperone HtpG
MITIGKFVLESLTLGMYQNPMIVFREYIQNSTDAIDNATKQGILEFDEHRIDINLDDKNIEILDNGLGISSDKAYSTLLDIGNSEKKYEENRGFRGIGRLGGLSYCSSLEFVTSAKGEKIKTRIKFNCLHLKELLRPGLYKDYDVVRVLKEITKHSEEVEDIEKHYFKVVMKGIDPAYDKLVNFDEVKSFLSQVAPVGFNAQRFVFYRTIKNRFNDSHLNLSEYNVYLNGNQIFKPFRSRFKAGRGDNTELIEIQSISFLEDKELNFLLWYTENDLFGSIQNEQIKGIRMRKGNILVGDQNSLSTLMFSGSNTRFHFWLQGELCIYDNRLIPNARRDDFEQNEYYNEFKDKLREIGREFEKKCRLASKDRSQIKNIKKAEDAVKKASIKQRSGFSSSKEKEKIIQELDRAKQKVEKIDGKSETLIKSKERALSEIEQQKEDIIKDKNYFGKLLSSYSRKERKIVEIILNVLQEKLDTKLASELADAIYNELLKK